MFKIFLINLLFIHYSASIQHAKSPIFGDNFRRNMQPYLSWRNDERDLTEPGKVFLISKHDHFDLNEIVQPKVANYCSNVSTASCFTKNQSIEPFLGALNSEFYRVPTPSIPMDDTIHHIISSRQIQVNGITGCHSVTSNLTVCHDHNLAEFDHSKLFIVKTDRTDELGVICHDFQYKLLNGSLLQTPYIKGCHLLFPGDIVFTKTPIH